MAEETDRQIAGRKGRKAEKLAVAEAYFSHRPKFLADHQPSNLAGVVQTSAAVLNYQMKAIRVNQCAFIERIAKKP